MQQTVVLCGGFRWFRRACVLRLAASVQLKRICPDCNLFIIARSPRSIRLLQAMRAEEQQALKGNIAPPTGRKNHTRKETKTNSFASVACLGAWRCLCIRPWLLCGQPSLAVTAQIRFWWLAVTCEFEPPHGQWIVLLGTPCSLGLLLER